MKFGLCCSADKAPNALAAGFDYVELPLGWLAVQSDLSGLDKVEATNLFFPGGTVLYESGNDAYLDYARAALDKAAGIGVKVSVLGSGGVRRAPFAGGKEWEDAFADIAARLSEVAKSVGIVLAPESLNRSETNVANDLGPMARRLARRGVAYTADSYHVLYEWRSANPDQTVPEPHVWDTDLPFAPAHVHLADLPRHPPAPDEPMLRGLVHRLRTLGYDGRVSLEATHGSDAESLSKALQNIKALFSQ